MVTKLLLTLTALFIGGWMVFDGIYVLTHGKYFGPPQPGPWAILPQKLGVNPFKLGSLFIGMGLLWFAAHTLYLTTGLPWSRYAAAAVAIGTLWYLPLGTVLSIVYLVLLMFLHNAG